MTTAVSTAASPNSFWTSCDLENRVVSFILVLFWLVISYFLIAA